MKRRDFPDHVAWSKACMNGDHALAFIVTQSRSPESELHFHLVYDGSHFSRLSEADEAADDALDKLVQIEREDDLVFSSARC
ncbi:hypothetical protein ACE0DR_13260 [Azotobacter sp. CWF10]